jgi:hypothetical protein
VFFGGVFGSFFCSFLVFFEAVLVVCFVPFWGCFRAVLVRFGGVLLVGLCYLLLFTCFSVFYDFLLFDLFTFFVYFFVFPPLADIFFPLFFYPAFAGFIFLIFSDLSACFVLALGCFSFCRRLWRSVFCPPFLSRFAGFISLVFSDLSACLVLTLGCFLFAAAFGGRFLPLFLSRFAGYISLIFSSLIVSFWRFLVRSVGFFVFPVPAVGGTFSPFFFRFQRYYIFDF